MAAAVIDTTGVNWFADGSSDTFTKSGSDNLLAVIGFAKSNATGRTLTSISWGSQAFTVDTDTSDLTISSITAHRVGGNITDANIPSGTSETLDAVWAGGSMQEDFNGAVLLLSGIDQTTPLKDQTATSGIQEEEFNGTTPTDLTYTASNGDIILYICVDNSEAYSDITNFTRVTTDPVTGDNQLDEGAIYYRIATSDLTNQTIPAPIGSSIGLHYVLVYSAAGAAGASLDDVDTDEITTDGQTSVSYTVSNMGTITGVEIQKIGDVTTKHTCTGVTASDFDIPDVSAFSGDTNGSPFTTASHTIQYYVDDGTDTATLAGTHNPGTGYAVVEVASAVKTSGSVFENFVGSIPDTSQVLYPTAETTSVSSTGILTTDKTSGSISMVYWDATSKNWQPFTVTISGVGGSLSSKSFFGVRSGIINGVSNGIEEL